MLKASNSLPEKVRDQISVVLQQALADSIDLMNQGKNLNWIVNGPDFMSLRLLFDQLAEDSEGYADTIAERIAQFGGIADGPLPHYPRSAVAGQDHVSALSHALAVYGEMMHTSIGQANELCDAGKAEENLWFVEAHAQTDYSGAQR